MIDETVTVSAAAIAALRAYLDDNLPSYLGMLHHMVSINSFTGNPDGVDDLAHVTSALFARMGFRPQTVRSSQHPTFGDHLVLTRPGRGPHRIGLVSHLDTVFPAEEERANQFVWREEGDRLYGPGTVDIKGGTVAIYMALDALRKFAPAVFDAVTWVVLFNSAEERSSPDFGPLCLEQMQPGGLACLVFEGGTIAAERVPVVVRRKGMAIWRITATGRASHAGTAHAAGANAVVQLAQVVQQIAGFTDYARELTFNVGRIEGGSVPNRVPHHAEALVEMRAYEPDVFQDGLRRMAALDGSSTVSSPRDGYACRVGVTLLSEAPPWPINPQTDRLFAHWQRAGQLLGLAVEPEQRGGLSDGNYLWNHLPTLDSLGPSGANAHCSERSADGSKDQEYAVRSSFVPKTLLNVLGILHLLAEVEPAARAWLTGGRG